MPPEDTIYGIDDYRTVIAAGFQGLECEAADAQQFTGQVVGAQHGKVSFYRINAAPHRVQRARRHIAHADPHMVKFSLQLSGQSTLQHRGRQVQSRPGDLVAYDTREPYEVTFDEASDILVIQLERSRFAIDDDALEAALAQPLETDAAAPAVGFFTELAKHVKLVELPTGQHYADGSVHMITPLLAAAGGAEGNERSRLLATIDAYIDEHLGDEHLGPTQLAAAHFISVRYLHALFRSRGTTVGQVVKNKRLRAALRMLQDPAYAGVSVGSIGARVGIPNPAQFSRSFKARYGCTPRCARARSAQNYAA